MKKNFSVQKSKGSKKDFSKGTKLAMSVAFGLGGGLMSLAALLLVFSVLCIMTKDPHAIMTPLSFAAIYLSAFIVGILCAKRNGSSYILVCGVLGGICFALLLRGIFFLLGIAGFVSAGDQNTFIWRMMIIPASMLGSLCSLKHSTPKRRKKH